MAIEVIGGFLFLKNAVNGRPELIKGSAIHRIFPLNDAGTESNIQFGEGAFYVTVHGRPQDILTAITTSYKEVTRR